MNAAQRIFDDLLNLEVSVILKPGMTARKMPAPAHALLDIIGDYDSFLCGAANAVNPHWDPSRPQYRCGPRTSPCRGRPGPI